MTLSFSTKWDKRMGELAGQPNYFVEQIWQSFPDEIPQNCFEDYLEGLEKVGYEFLEDAADINSKLHTIRHDLHNRWKAGMKIHFVINNRTKKRFQFAPVVKCVDEQRIFIVPNLKKVKKAVPRYEKGKLVAYQVGEEIDCETLSINDGFPDIDSFFRYFDEHNGAWTMPKIIHWTDLKY